MGLTRLSRSGSSKGRTGRFWEWAYDVFQNAAQRQLRLLCSLSYFRSSSTSKYLVISSPNVCRLKLKWPQAAATSSKSAWIFSERCRSSSMCLYSSCRASALAVLNSPRASVRLCLKWSLIVISYDGGAPKGGSRRTPDKVKARDFIDGPRRVMKSSKISEGARKTEGAAAAISALDSALSPVSSSSLLSFGASSIAESTATRSLPLLSTWDSDRLRVCGKKIVVPGDMVPDSGEVMGSFSSANWVFAALRSPPIDCARVSIDLYTILSSWYIFSRPRK